MIPLALILLAACGFVGWAIIRGNRLFDDVVANETDAERAGVFYAGPPEMQDSSEEWRGEIRGMVGRVHGQSNYNNAGAE